MAEDGMAGGELVGELAGTVPGEEEEERGSGGIIGDLITLKDTFKFGWEERATSLVRDLVVEAGSSNAVPLCVVAWAALGMIR